MTKILRYSALTLGGFIVLAAVGLFIVTRDEAPPDIVDLTPRPLTVPPEENAFLILQKLAAEFSALPKDEAYIATLTRLDSENGWSITDATQVVHHADSIWPRFDAAAGLAQNDDALPTTSGKRYAYISGLNQLWDLALIRIKLTAQTAGPDQALTLALNTQRKARFISDAGGTMVETLVGLGMYAMAHQTLQEILTQGTPSSAVLLPCIGELEKNRMSASAFADSFKTAYSHMPAEIEDMRRKHGSDSDSFDLDLPRGAQWLYKPNQTARILAEHTRKLINAIDQPYWVIKGASQINVSPFLFAKVPTPNNAYGKAFIEIIPAVYTSVLKSRMKVQTSVSVTQAWLAVTLFERANGRLPDSLDQLAPEYFPAVPRDYFTGKAIRYSAVALAVWSAGENDLILASADQEIPPRAIAMKLKPPASTP